jgi:hypothetical protein
MALLELELKLPEGLSDSEIRGFEVSIATAVADMARAEWIRLAQSDLTSTQQDYIAGIGPPQQRGGFIEITLGGKLPNMIEGGFAGGDMRKTHLSGPSVKTSKEGHKYMSVPFRHATSGTRGFAGRVMPRGVYQAAKKLRGTLTGPDGRVTLWGERLKSGLAAKLQPHHETDIYASMIRAQKTYEATSQSSYHTFRTISDNPGTRKFITPAGGVHRGAEPPQGSREAGWIHPGIDARHFAPRVKSFVESQASALISAMTGG